MTFQPASSPTNRSPSRSFDRDDLGEEDAALVGEELAGLGADGDAQTAEAPCEDRGVGVEVQRRLAGVRSACRGPRRR